MFSGRKLLVYAILIAMPMLAGCGWLLLAGGTSAAYIATSPTTNEAMTAAANVKPVGNVEEAVKVWLSRGQLPLPVLEDGVHNFTMRSTKLVKVKNSRGARLVELYDHGKGGTRLIAEYVVSWDRRPVEYRVAAAQNKLYGGSLDVSGVPVIKTYE